VRVGRVLRALAQPGNLFLLFSFFLFLGGGVRYSRLVPWRNQVLLRVLEKEEGGMQKRGAHCVYVCVMYIDR